MIDSSAESYLRQVVEKRADPFLSMVILGLQGSGKTNIVRWIINILDDWHVGYVFPSMISSPRDLIDDIIVLIDSCEGKKMMLVVDDISFLYRTALQRTTAELLNLYARVRHLRPDIEKWFWVWIQHDVTASAPFIRASDLLIITKIDFTQWIRLMRDEKIFIRGDYLEDLREKDKEMFLFIDKLGKKLRRKRIIGMKKEELIISRRA